MVEGRGSDASPSLAFTMWVIGVLTFALPWVIWPGVSSPFLEPKEWLFLAGGWTLVLWRTFRIPSVPSLGWRNPWTAPVVIWMALWSIWKFQGHYLLRTPSQVELHQNIIYNAYVWSACTMVILAALLARDMALTWLKSDLNLHRVTQWTCWSATACAVYAICQALGFDQWYTAWLSGNVFGNSIYAGFGNPGYLAIYLACILPLCFLFSAKRYLLYAGLILIAIWLTNVRYAWVIAGSGVAAALIVRWWTRCRWITRAILVMLGGAGVVGVLWNGWAILQTDERWPLWQQIVEQLQKSATNSTRVMTGYGLESFPLWIKGSHQWAHNDWLQTIVELGIIGTGMLFGMVVWSLRSGWRKATQSLPISGWFGVFIAFLTATVIHFPTHVMPVAWIGLCAWAILERTVEAE